MDQTKNDALRLIDLDLDRPGYRSFISCWVYRGPQLTFIVDPGPRASTHSLQEGLRRLGVDKIDFVLLTHIHLDHGGGSAELLKAFPEAGLYCHPSGAPHMLDPSRLWKASQVAIGDIADVYGRPTAVPAGRLVDQQALERRGIRVLPTPGHAAHHVCFLVDDILFAGEAIATRMELASGQPYLRPATPARFIADVFFDSLAELERLQPEPALTAFAHYGVVPDLRRWCRMAGEQLRLWIELVHEMHSAGEDRPQTVFEALLERDRFFGQGRFDELPPDIQQREHYYAINSLRGILQYVGDKQSP